VRQDGIWDVRLVDMVTTIATNRVTTGTATMTTATGVALAAEAEAAADRHRVGHFCVYITCLFFFFFLITNAT
jgi:hypothetical protein